MCVHHIGAKAVELLEEGKRPTAWWRISTAELLDFGYSGGAEYEEGYSGRSKYEISKLLIR